MPIKTTKVRGLLGVLAFKANEPVAPSYLAEALWDDRPDPTRPLHTYVSRLRNALKAAEDADVVNEHGYYRLRVNPATVDYHDFLARSHTARRAAGKGDHPAAAELFVAALNLWRGPLLAEIKTSWADRQRDALLVRELLSAQCALLESKLALDEHDFVLDALPSLLADHPDDNWLARLWMRVLAATNRAQEVPPFYRAFRERLESEHGAAPHDDTEATYESVIGRTVTVSAPAPARVPEPPRTAPCFTGRTELLRRLDKLLAGPESPVTLVALDGKPGVGKTTLVLHWAHRQRSRFPDGIVYLDLAGYSTAKPVDPSTAMGDILDQLGVPTDRVPRAIDDRAALLRQILTGRQVLLVLDNAKDSSHVRPILAGTANSTTVITSRLQLNGIAFRDAAERIIVPELTADEATALLSERIGERATRDPLAVRNLVALCGRIPLALRIVGEHAARRPMVPVGDLADELRQTRRLLDIGSDGDDDSTTLRSTFTLSYRALQPAQARLFRMLGLLPTTQFSVAAASAVSSVERPAIDNLLDTLVAAHLVEQEQADRYRVHDLLHQFAADKPPDDRDRATLRMLTWYVRTARTARSLITTDPHDVPDLPAAEPVTPIEFDGGEDARRWIELERESLIALTHLAAERDHHEHVWRLAACLHETKLYGDLRDLLAVHELGAKSAMLAGAPAAAAGCQNNMGHIFQLLDDALRAGRCFEQAYHAFHTAGDDYGETVSLHNIGTTHLMRNDPAEAIRWYRRALDRVTAANDEWAAANVHGRLGDAYRQLDQHDEATSHYQRAWRIGERLDDQRGQGVALNRLARLSLDMDHPKEAIEFGRLALDKHDRTGDRGSAAEVLCTLAAAKIKQHAPAQAAGDAMEAARTYREMGNVSGEATSLSVLADALSAAGEAARAEEVTEQIASLHDGLDDPLASSLRERARRPGKAVPVPRPATPPRATRKDYSPGA